MFCTMWCMGSSKEFAQDDISKNLSVKTVWSRGRHHQTPLGLRTLNIVVILFGWNHLHQRSCLRIPTWMDVVTRNINNEYSIYMYICDITIHYIASLICTFCFRLHITYTYLYLFRCNMHCKNFIFTLVLSWGVMYYVEFFMCGVSLHYCIYMIREASQKKTVHAPDTIMEMEHDHIFPIPNLTRPLCPWDFGSFQQTLVLLYSFYQLYGVQFTVSKWMAPTSYISLPLNRTKWHMAWAEDPKYLAAYSKASAVRVWCWICVEDMVLF